MRNDMRFIYVIDEKTKKKFLRAGFQLLKEDDKNSIWIFANKEPNCFSAESDGTYVFSDVMSF